MQIAYDAQRDFSTNKIITIINNMDDKDGKLPKQIPSMTT